MELDSQTVPKRIRAGHLERARGHVDSRHASAGVLVRDRQRDRAAAGPDVENVSVADLRQAREAALDDDLGLGPWDENTPIDVQGEPPEPPLTEHVRKRLALLAARDESLERLLLVASDLRLEHELRPRDPDDMGDENLGFDLRRLDADASQAVGDASDRVPHTGCHAALHPVGEHALGETFALESFAQPVVVGTELRDVAIVELDHGGRNTIDRTGVEEPVDDRSLDAFDVELEHLHGLVEREHELRQIDRLDFDESAGVDVALERQHARPDRRADRVVHRIDMEVQAGDSRAIEDSLRMEVHGLGALEPPLEDRVGVRVRLERVHSGAPAGELRRHVADVRSAIDRHVAPRKPEGSDAPLER